MSEMADAIMDAAEKRIRLGGYGGFSFRDIAADVGVKSASVHYHFPTKDKLAATVARRYTDRFVAAVDRRLAAGEDIIGASRHVFRDALFNDGKMCLCGALGATASDLSEEVRHEVQRFFRLALDRLQQAGVAPVDAVQVLATLEGAMLTANVLENLSLFDSGTETLKMKAASPGSSHQWR
ncbi:TetR/AcrR family transcriptional regulator [Mesorhizobium atlanticum]|uniref:TetR/AcrR family transcriptional regulator n=1 Tax=Mesorhizobium atlanticum TaxID=2233532 RepID=A0A330GNA4_9HYPH|nr:TetR/AcrR family transcriptional regulator [Mesorhizobium atlanticum]RAZ72961.1 TetR/AcrR family transcriptional regulator [Mesorhizobium atlanticum]